MVIKIKDYKIKAIPSENNSEGMMGKKFNSNFLGMLFYLTPGPQSFWMKGCIIPLDIIFIHNKKIHNIQHNCEPCKTDDCQTYDGYGDLVLELPAGTCKKYGIQSGDKVNF